MKMTLYSQILNLKITKASHFKQSINFFIYLTGIIQSKKFTAFRQPLRSTYIFHEVKYYSYTIYKY
ncbi:hypothetical protein SAMN05216344_110122 [Polaromonas sp. OV174]|nr:hypothetical protein SAMN05216344_110122 [Polaromonas sp. OV174]